MKKFLSILCVLVFTIFAFVGCGKSFSSMASLPAVGNGGLAVLKGDWIYYVNGFASKNDNLNKNKEGKVTLSGIYRVKASDVSYNVADGKLSFTSGKIATDENENIVGSELIVSKVCGFENAGLYIFGDYIYFTTPNNLTSKDGQVFVNDLDFCRARLDGEKFKVLGTVSSSSENYSNLKTKFFSLQDKVYFSAFDGKDSLSIFEITNKKTTEIFKTSEVTALIYSEINQNFENIKFNALDNRIFFTKNSSLQSYDLATKTNVTHTTFSANESFKFIKNTGNNLFYSIEKNEITTVYCNPCPSYFKDGQRAIISVNDTTFTSFDAISGRENLVAVSGSNIFIYDNSGNEIKNYSVANASIVGIYEDSIFYISNEDLYVINLFNEAPTAICLETKVSLKTDVITNISITCNNVFFYKTFEDGSCFVEMINYKQLNDGSVAINQLLKA